MRVSVEYTRGREMMYLSHLDMMRTFVRALRRAGIPLAYTEGFNPHAKLVFGLPMQVGVTGSAECLDIEVEDIPGADAYISRLNAFLPEGLSVNAAREVISKENVMAIITHASYEMNVRIANGAPTEGLTAGALLSLAIEAFLTPGPRTVTIEPTRGSRRGGAQARPDAPTACAAGASTRGADASASVKTVDLAPLIKSISSRGDVLELTVTAGSVNNVKPDMALRALNGILGEIKAGASLERVSLHRAALYTERGGVLYRPADALICGDINTVRI